MTKVTEKYVYFWGEVFSNWYPCKFKVMFPPKEIEFSSSEQYFMYMKAITFYDFTIAERILKEGNDPESAKKLGKMVRLFNAEKWEKVRYKIMFDANYYKYSQNEHLKQELLKKEYINLHFVEGTPNDPIWGICCNYKDAKDDHSNWKGLNLLGKVLDDVRSVLIHGGNMINF